MTTVLEDVRTIRYTYTLEFPDPPTDDTVSEADRILAEHFAPADQGPFGTDVTDEMIATFERLEAAHPDATPQQLLAMAQPRITADGTPNKYDTGEWNMAWLDVRTPIVTLEDGATIAGTYEVDGERACVHLEASDGQFYAGTDGSISGDWADVEFEDLTLEQIEKLRQLFTGPQLPALIDAAKGWCAA